MALMNSLVRRLVDQIKGRNLLNPTATNTNLNNSPRFVDINKPRTTQFSGADVNSNSYGKIGGAPVVMAAKEGGEILARGNRLARMRKTKLY
jgi:hypothetical protein